MKNNKINKKVKKQVQNNKNTGFSNINQVVGIKKPTVFHSKIQVSIAKTINEPKDLCPLCNKEIANISQAIYSPNDEIVHFDCALAQIKESNKLLEGQVISYIGKGNFAICEKNEEDKWVIVNRIPYENSENNLKFKEYVEGAKS